MFFYFISDLIFFVRLPQLNKFFYYQVVLIKGIKSAKAVSTIKISQKKNKNVPLKLKFLLIAQFFVAPAK